MSIGNLFHRFLTEWSYLEKQMIEKEVPFLRKKPSHALTKNLDIEFSIKAIESNESSRISTSIESVEKINYEQGVSIKLKDEHLEPTQSVVVEGLLVNIIKKENNSFLIYFSANKEKNPQFSLFISYLILYMKDRTFKQAYSDALHDLDNYWAAYSLSKNIQVGLFGELYILELVAKTIGWKKALDSWKGPEKGLHDFVFENTLLEIKTTESDPPKIFIDNPEQFFIPISKKLILNVCNVYIGEGQNIQERVTKILESMEDELKSVFRSKVYDFGFFEKLLPAKLYKIKVINSQQVSIIEKNMSLSKDLIDSLPPSVTRIKYTLDTSNFVFNASEPNSWVS
tara:strand:+ start:1441 stop:2463 length:1023 start_codon:yes stop_codon:yes gene_type:complete